MNAWFWDTLASVLALPRVFEWLIRRAKRTPYMHITSADGSDVYMYRYWLFNAYPWPAGAERSWWRERLPSIRLHRIMRPDTDRDLHDHPWNARTLILDGFYQEIREGNYPLHVRMAGTSAHLSFGEFHRIINVSSGGVWTMFITWKYRGTWGFKVNGVKVPWRTYLGLDK